MMPGIGRHGFSAKLMAKAEEAVSQAELPAAKIGPDPPHLTTPVGAAGTTAKDELSLVPHTTSGDEPLPVTFRPHVNHITLELALERAGTRLPAGDSARLVALVEEKLGGRAVDALSSAQRSELVSALRNEMAQTSPGAERQQRILRELVRKSPSRDITPDVRRSSVTVRGGSWIFWYSPSPTSPVILGESFVPTKLGTPVPKSRPDPVKAGIGGTPRWRTPDGRIIADPLPLPTKPVVARTGLDANALEQGPELILDEVRHAQLAALESAERQAAPVALRGRGAGAGRTGERIHRIEYYTASAPAKDREWDWLIVVEGVTGPEVTRLSSTELDKVLRPRRTLASNEGLTRLHAFGPIFGDETLAGLAYGPHEAFNLVQKDTVEDFLRFNAKRMGGINIKAGTPVKVSQYVKDRYVRFAEGGGARLPFVRTVRYDFTYAPGEFVSVILDITPEGKVSFYVLR